MPIVSISSNFDNKAETIARRVAEKTGYRILDGSFLEVVADRYNISRSAFADLFENKRRLWGGGRRSRRRALAILQQAVLQELLQDRVVTYGLGAHLYVTGVSHFIRVRIVADSAQRARAIAQTRGISLERASKQVKLQDRNRLQWSLEFFDLDESDPSLHDLLINLGTVPEDEAVKMICDATAAKPYQPVTYSIKCLEDQALAAKVQSALLDRFPEIKLKARGSTVFVFAKASSRHKHKTIVAIKEAAREVEGVDYVEVHLSEDSFQQATKGIP